MKRSSHIAIMVPADKVEQAAAYYRNVLGAEEQSRKDSGIELAGPNFMLYVEPSDRPVVLQEFVSADGPSARDRFAAAGCTIFDESEFGFHVTDPYGMSYHIWVEKNASPPEA
jgi:catechol 2,3-dioxygenase-like lactoylglutathione lyase family enzyme